MLGRFRTAMTYALDVLAPVEEETGADVVLAPREPKLDTKFPYGRPSFLKLSDDEVQASCDQILRPILIPRNSLSLVWNSGYAEVVNSGKSKVNEDQAAIHKINITLRHGRVVTRNYAEQKRIVTTKRPRVKSRSGSDRSRGRGGSGGSDAAGSSAGSRSDLRINSSPDDLAEIRPAPMEEAPVDDGVETFTFTYFGVFDGHAGTGAAMFAANSLHLHIRDKLLEIAPVIHDIDENPSKYVVPPPSRRNRNSFVNSITVEGLVTGAIENAFQLMDTQIAVERSAFRVSGGCTCVVALVFRNKIYVANAGDSRAILIRDGKVALSTTDFTPETERQRIQELASSHPALLGDEFSPLQYLKRTTSKDLGEPIYYRDHNMQGWSIKTAEESDLKPSVIAGVGKRQRVMQTIGVTRGFGDFDLKVFDTEIRLKPFLLPTPEILVHDLVDLVTGAPSIDDVVVMATDGLWDVMSNDAVAASVSASFLSGANAAPARQRYTLAAQDLVMQVRGLASPTGNRSWRLPDGRHASEDDVTCLVIPLRGAAISSVEGRRLASESGFGRSGSDVGRGGSGWSRGGGSGSGSGEGTSKSEAPSSDRNNNRSGRGDNAGEREDGKQTRSSNDAGDDDEDDDDDDEPRRKWPRLWWTKKSTTTTATTTTKGSSLITNP